MTFMLVHPAKKCLQSQQFCQRWATTTQASWLGSGIQVSHWRQDKKQVDIVVQDGEQEVTGFEVKAAAKVNQADAKGLIQMQDVYGERFNIGYLVYTGSTSYEISDKIWALPIAKLWSQ